MFPEELGEHTFDIQRMMKGCHLTSRNLYVLLPVLEERVQQLSTAKIHEINDLMITVYRGKLAECIEDQWSETQRAKEVHKTVGYMKALLDL